MEWRLAEYLLCMGAVFLIFSLVLFLLVNSRIGDAFADLVEDVLKLFS